MDNSQKNNEIRTLKVVHVQIGSEHKYFGSIKAMVDNIGEDVIGIKERKMRDMRISQLPEYTTPTGAIIRIGRLITTQKKGKVNNTQTENKI